MIFAYVLLPSAVMPTQIMAWHGHVLPLGPCQLKAADWYLRALRPGTKNAWLSKVVP